MTATFNVLVPFDRSPAIELAGGRLWRKRLLPVGRVAYKGRMLDFSPKYLANLADAFRARAYDQVALQLAPDDNRHTNDPERYAGEVIDAEAQPDGLWITVKATDRGNRVLQENPQLGISARIVEDYLRSDGKFFPAALQHVLATLDPRIPALGPWSSIEAAVATDEVPMTIDLSGSAFEGGDGHSLRDQALAALGLPADATDEEVGAVMEAVLEADEEDQALASWAEGLDMREALGGGSGSYTPPGEAELAQLASISQALDMSSALDELRTIEDAEPLPRLPEDRLSHLLARVGFGSYTPHSPGHPAHPGQPGPVLGQPNCGPSEPEFGYCMNRQHTPGCSSMASTAEAAEAIRGTLAHAAWEPLTDDRGEPWLDQHGDPLTLAGAVEAAAGVRLTMAIDRLADVGGVSGRLSCQRLDRRETVLTVSQAAVAAARPHAHALP